MSQRVNEQFRLLLSLAPYPPTLGGKPCYSPQDWRAGGRSGATEAIFTACLSSHQFSKWVNDMVLLKGLIIEER